MIAAPASLRFRLIAGAGAIALVAIFAALLAAWGAAETVRRIEQSGAAQQRMDLLSALSARIGDYAVIAVEAAGDSAGDSAGGLGLDAGGPGAGAARLRSSAGMVADAFARIERALAAGGASPDRAAPDAGEGDLAQMRRAARSLSLARMRARFADFDGAVRAARSQSALRAALDGFAVRFSPLLNAAIAEERRNRDAAAASVADLRRWMLWLALGAGLAALTLVILFHMLLIRPLIARLGLAEQAAEGVGRGDFAVALPAAQRDELGRLFGAINRMAARLKRRSDAVDEDRARLNDTVARRTGELSEANDRLSRIDAERRRFFADVGHELRTPLTVILAESELGLGARADPAELTASLGIIRSRAVRLNRRIDDMLRVARSETGQIELTVAPFDLAAAAQNAMADAAPLARQRRLTLTARLDPAWALGDADWCRQVAGGLIENAIRHSPEGGVIEIAAAAADGVATLSVTDEGEGLAEGDSARVFGRFARGAREGAGTGFGVGLALAAWVAQRQDGAVTLQSPAPRPPAGGAAGGRGAQAALTLPAADAGAGIDKDAGAAKAHVADG